MILCTVLNYINSDDLDLIDFEDNCFLLSEEK